MVPFLRPGEPCRPISDLFYRAIDVFQMQRDQMHTYSASYAQTLLKLRLPAAGPAPEVVAMASVAPARPEPTPAPVEPEAIVEEVPQVEEQAVTIEAALPGVHPEDVEITVHQDNLTISVREQAERETKEGERVYRELRRGSGSRTLWS